MIEKDLTKRLDQYNKPETYKEKFYEVVRFYQKKDGLTQEKAIKKAEFIFREKDKKQQEAKQQKKELSNYEALIDIDFDDDYEWYIMDIVEMLGYE